MPWFNDSIHTARRERRRAVRKWRKSRSDQDRELYMKEKRYVFELTETAKESYFKDKCFINSTAIAEMRLLKRSN